ncbi:MAG: hypothetical protein BA870_11065 [Desulfuromonadales bacterium C00003094]|nr:MAG: hypothetical protein BA870_11065 [Desulfuromonadales bacterium C00003094]OEU75579.1 MAG: hypothetical protein BA869_12285 [Desulfuromonadales bacterium C00003107]
MGSMGVGQPDGTMSVVLVANHGGDLLERMNLQLVFFRIVDRFSGCRYGVFGVYPKLGQGFINFLTMGLFPVGRDTHADVIHLHL